MTPSWALDGHRWEGPPATSVRVRSGADWARSSAFQPIRTWCGRRVGASWEPRPGSDWRTRVRGGRMDAGESAVHLWRQNLLCELGKIKLNLYINDSHLYIPKLAPTMYTFILQPPHTHLKKSSPHRLWTGINYSRELFFFKIEQNKNLYSWWITKHLCLKPIPNNRVTILPAAAYYRWIDHLK